MSTFNAGAIEASLTLDRSSWNRDLKELQAEFEKLESKSISIMIDADTDNFMVGVNNVELFLESLDEKSATIAIDADSDKFHAAAAQVELTIEQLEQMSPVITVDMDSTKFHAAAAQIELTLEQLGTMSPDVKVDMDSTAFHAAAAQVELTAEVLGTLDPTINVGMDSTAFHVGAAQVELTADLLNGMDAEINVGMDSTAFHAGAAQVELAADIMGQRNITVGVETSGVPKTLAELAEVEVAAEIVDGKTVHINMDYDRNGFEKLVGKSGSSFSGFGGGGGGGGSMGLLGMLITAIIALSPILVVAVGAMSAAIVGFLAAIIGALGPLGLLVGMIVLLIKAYKKTPVKDMTEGMLQLHDALKGFKDLLAELVHSDAGEVIFKSLAILVFAATEALKAFIPLVMPLAQLFKAVANNIFLFVESREFKTWVNFFSGFGLDMLSMFIAIGGDLIRFLMNLFIAIAPFARKLMSGLTGDLGDLAKWSANLKNNKGFHDWIRDALHYGPLLLGFLGDLWRILTKVADAVEPFADPMLTAFDNIADALDKIPTPVLTQLIAAGTLLFAAWKIVIPVFSTLAEVGGAVAEAFGADAIAFGLPLLPIIAIVAAAAGLAAMFIYLYDTHVKLRKQVSETWKQIQDTVKPIISDISDVIKEHWGDIVAWAQDIWTNVKQIFLSAATIIHQIVFFLLIAISFIWKHYGDLIIKYVVEIAKGIGLVFRGIFRVIAGVMQLIADVLTGKWSNIGQDLIKIIHGFWDIIQGIFHLAFAGMRLLMSVISRTLENIWGAIWDWITGKAKAGWGWVRSTFDSFIGWLGDIPGRIGNKLGGMWDGLTAGFRDAVNSIVRWWNNLSFGIPGFNPPGPGSFPGITVSTPNIPEFAGGAYVDKPTLSWVGEGNEPEIVSPVSKMAEIVRMYANKDIDYDRLASAVSNALGEIKSSVLTPNLLERILSKAGVTIPVHAENDDRSVRSLMTALDFQLRVLGYPGATP